jgi:hypothetical protein
MQNRFRAAAGIGAARSRTSSLLRLRGNRRGSVALLGLVAMTSILGMAGFAIDLGAAYVQQARLQKVADSAAMAGAISWVKTGSVAATTATIKAVVLANGWPATAIQAKPPYLAQSPRNSAFPAIQVGLTAPSSFGFLRAITTATSATTTAYAVVEAGNAASSTPIASLFNTGVNAAGVVLSSGTNNDPHYTFNLIPNGASATIQIGSSGAASYWTPPNTTSAWISPVGGQGNVPNGWYGYRTTFDLTGFDPASTLITGQVDGDDQVAMQLNSADAIGTNANYYASATFVINTGFISGINVLVFYVNNTGGATGLRVAMTGTAARTGGKIALVQ